MRKLLASTFLSLFCLSSLHAGYVFQDGKIYDAKFSPKFEPKTHFDMGLGAFQSEQWNEAYKQFRTLVEHFGETSYGEEALFYTGAAAYHLGEEAIANEFLSQYLSKLSEGSHFEEAFSYKYSIAEAYREGAKRHLFGIEKLPKWASGKDEALEIYDEIIFSFPASNLAAQSYFSKALVYTEMKDYTSAMEIYHQLITKFPNHPKSARAFVKLSDIYRLQLNKSTLDPDLLEHARVNLRRFARSFPGDPLVAEVEKQVLQMEEMYAESLFETGQLYERKKQAKASVVYYYSLMKQFPNTKTAQQAGARLSELESYAKEVGISIDA